MDYSSMAEGDRAGLALFRDVSAWVGVQKINGAFRVSFWSGLTMSSTWATSNVGKEVAGAAVSGGKIWLRIYADIQPSGTKKGTFLYSTDGTSFKELGKLSMITDWHFFMGYRYAIFNQATKALGGKVTVASFTVDAPGRTTP